MATPNRRNNGRRNSVVRLNKVLPVPIHLEDRNYSAEHFNASSHVTDVLVGDHHIIQGEGGLSYVVWSVRVIVNDSLHSSIVIYKRYSDIQKFRARLVKHHPHIDIPVLPPKDTFSFLRLMMASSWLEHRRKGLQWFMTNVLLNPKFQHSPVVTEFILL